MRSGSVKQLALINRVVLVMFALLGIAACDGGEQSAQDSDQITAPIRGLKAVTVGSQETTSTRQYASVLQPAEVTSLSFELAGKTTAVSLRVGQPVKKGQLLASLETDALQLQVDTAGAALRQAIANARNTTADFQRKRSLKTDGMITAAQLDQARAAALSGESSVEQAQNQLESATTDLQKAQLLSPIDGIVSSVNLESYANVSAGTPVVDIYSDKALEARFSVSYVAVNQLFVGQQVRVIPSDSPDVSLQAVITEVASRADTVSSFPVVITLQQNLPTLRAGMAAAVQVDFELPRGQGFSLPLSVISQSEQVSLPENPVDPIVASVFVYQEEDSSVRQRQVEVAGVSGNNVVVIDGLEAGEIVAVAGVSFLRDGQIVKLIDKSSL